MKTILVTVTAILALSACNTQPLQPGGKVQDSPVTGKSLEKHATWSIDADLLASYDKSLPRLPDNKPVTEKDVLVAHSIAVKKLTNCADNHNGLVKSLCNSIFKDQDFCKDRK